MPEAVVNGEEILILPGCIGFIFELKSIGFSLKLTDLNIVDSILNVT